MVSGGLVVTALPVGASAPAYLRRRLTDGATDGCWVTAYRIEDLATGGVLVHAPRLAARGADLDELLAGADCAVLDGGGRPPGATVPAATAPAGTSGPRRVPIRLDDMSPLLDPASAARTRGRGGHRGA
ncbi:hypothetical protein [Streptomyces chromofuscus]|uniref:hypothetical protein n=1 Tax=Streptomyces chromofuscus TaxID=42881 RepID=UPI001996C40A|nr:hypothetical protein [Streptomyces chromofuscus]GGT40233.1 hypothetical protein GCM10010254_70140 [Streptomyces chromofuscus]